MQESIILFSEISSQHKVLKENADLFCEKPDRYPTVYRGKEACKGFCESSIQVDILFTKADIKEVVKDNDNKEWYRIQVQDKEGKKKGYIKKEELKEVSAHNWIDFGFTIRKVSPRPSPSFSIIFQYLFLKNDKKRKDVSGS